MSNYSSIASPPPVLPWIGLTLQGCCLLAYTGLEHPDPVVLIYICILLVELYCTLQVLSLKVFPRICSRAKTLCICCVITSYSRCSLSNSFHDFKPNNQFFENYKRNYLQQPPALNLCFLDSLNIIEIELTISNDVFPAQTYFLMGTTIIHDSFSLDNIRRSRSRQREQVR